MEDAGEGGRVILVGVHAAIRDQAKQVAGAAALAQGGDQVAQRGGVSQRRVLDRGGDAAELLGDDAAGADVEVADLGVAHLAAGEPDLIPVRAQKGARASGPEAVESRCRGLRDRVVGRLLAPAEAVEDHQHDGTRRRRHPQAAAAGASLEATGLTVCSTSKPSNSGWPRYIGLLPPAPAWARRNASEVVQASNDA